jgi:hypothetical protein
VTCPRREQTRVSRFQWCFFDLFPALTRGVYGTPILLFLRAGKRHLRGPITNVARRRT